MADDKARELALKAGQLLADGRHADAKPLFVRALSLRERDLGPTHSDTLTTLCNLGSCLAAAGTFGEAEKALEKSLLLRESSLGKFHADCAHSLTSLSSIAELQGHVSKAVAFNKRAVAVFDRMLRGGALSDIDFAQAVAALTMQARLQQQQEEWHPAFLTWERIRALHAARTGEVSLDLGRTLAAEAALFRAQGDWVECCALLEKALAVFEAPAVNAPPALILETLGHLANAHEVNHQPAQAIPVLQRLLQWQARVAGPDDMTVADLQFVLAQTMREDPTIAKPAIKALLEQACRTYAQLLGRADPKTIEAQAAVDACTDADELQARATQAKVEAKRKIKAEAAAAAAAVAAAQRCAFCCCCFVCCWPAPSVLLVLVFRSPFCVPFECQ